MRSGLVAGALVAVTMGACAADWAFRAVHAVASAAPHVQDRAPSSTERTAWDGVYTAAQQKRGEPIYVRECSTCHGETLQGGEGSPPLTGSEFNERWSGRTVADLFENIRLTMPPPPDTPGRLTPQQNADVVAYILSANGFPASRSAKLPADLTILKQIRLTFTREPPSLEHPVVPNP